VAALCPKRFDSSGEWRPGPLNMRYRYHHDPDDPGIGRLITASDLLDPRGGEYHNAADREAIVPVLRKIALEFTEYDESGATSWDTMMDVRSRPEWLKELGRAAKEASASRAGASAKISLGKGSVPAAGKSGPSTRTASSIEPALRAAEGEPPSQPRPKPRRLTEWPPSPAPAADSGDEGASTRAGTASSIQPALQAAEGEPPLPPRLQPRRLSDWLAGPAAGAASAEDEAAMQVRQRLPNIIRNSQVQQYL